MQPSNRQLLQAIRSGLGQLWNAASGSRALISQIDIAVGELIARSDGRRESLENSCQGARALAGRGIALLRQIGDQSLDDRSDLTSSGVQGDLETIERTYQDVKALLADCVLRVSAAASEGDKSPTWTEGARRFFFDLASLEMQRAVDDFNPGPGNEASAQDAVDQDRVKTYFQHWPGRGGPLELLELRVLSGGFSRQTLLARLRDPSGTDISLILRKQLSGGLLGSSCLDLAGEVPFLNLAHAAGLPVAEVFCHEIDESILGGEFIVMACLRGETLGSSIGVNVGIGDAFMRDLAQTLARLHRVDWSPAAAALCSASGLERSQKVTAAQSALAACAAFERMWREANLDPLPTLELILDWLKRSVPPTQRLAAISHGDVGFHNLMGSEGRLTGLIDWETARLADPAKDMAMVRPLVGNYVPWSRFLAWYRDAGGPELDEQSLTYYSVYHAFTHLIVCEVAIGSRFSQSAIPLLGYLQLGLPVRAFFAQELLRDCAPIWRPVVVNREQK